MVRIALVKGHKVTLAFASEDEAVEWMRVIRQHCRQMRVFAGTLAVACAYLHAVADMVALRAFAIAGTAILSVLPELVLEN